MRRILLKCLMWLSLLALIVSGGYLLSLYKYRNIKKVERTSEGVACAIHKTHPVQFPNNNLVIFMRQDGAEFYLEDKGVYDKIERGDCIRYRYHEFVEYDSSKESIKNGKVTGFSYDIQFLQKRTGPQNNA